MDYRLFIAIELDHAARRLLGKTVERLRRIPGRIRWVSLDQMHLTLAFLGQTSAEQAPQVAAAMERAAAGIGPFEFSLAGLGAFPDAGRPRVIWIGVEESAGVLARLQDRLAKELTAAGFPGEDREFHPHVTLGRVRQAERDVDYEKELARPVDFRGAEQSATELVLFSSEQGDRGPIYTPLARAKLTG
ncbi:MAG: RNA 2',3'-cyclic phosphodiesterase [Phycisphaerae bacterium]|nr:RNA 2',3'-cyclic phosphodiesterase [Phycisphaerae bacterium]